VLNHRFWVEKLGGDPGIVEKKLVLNGKSYQVAGVVAPVEHVFLGPVDCYVPMGLFRSDTSNRAQHGSMRLLARLKPNVTLAAARADLDSIMQHLAENDPGPENDHRSYGAFLAEYYTRDIRPTLLILLGAVGLVLLIACANVASLVLARSTLRVQELAVRAAIGAGRMRIVRQLLTENLLIALMGGIAGLLFAKWCLSGLIRLGPREIPRLAETRLDFTVLFFAAGITLVTGLIVGLAPLVSAGKMDLISALKDTSRTAIGTRSGQSLRSALVVSEIAITFVLAFTSGLLLRSLVRAQTVYPGFDPQRLLALELALPSSTYKGPAVPRFYDQLMLNLRNLPGVAAVSAVNCPPSGGDCGDWFYSVLDRPAPARGDVPIALFNTADESYFRTAGIPLREGRAFANSDQAGGPKVAIVNEVFARKWWPKETAVGRQIKSGGPYIEGPAYEIVGVVGNVSQMGLDAEAMPEIFLPFTQSPSTTMVVMLRTSVDPQSVMPAVRRRVAEMDRSLPIQRLRTMESRLADTLERRRFSTLLLALFALLAMTLAAVGIYGLLDYWVNVREESIAIRLALGAQRSAILRWVGAQAFRLAALGIALGLAGGWAASRWIESLIFGVSAHDPATVTVAAVLVIAIAMAAAAIPMWRAARVDAIRFLHHS
jgi:putative ABC transport system permease protein